MLIGFLLLLVVVTLELLLGNPIFSFVVGVSGRGGKHFEPLWLNIIVGFLAFFMWPLGILFIKNIGQNPFNKFKPIWVVSGFIFISYLAFLVNYPTGVIALSLGIFGAAIFGFLADEQLSRVPFFW